MTDKYAELKRFAEAAIEFSSEWHLSEHMRNIFDWEEADFIAAANPAVVRELLAENERLRALLCMCRDCGGQGEIYSGHSTYHGYNQPPEPDMDVCGACGGDGVLGPVEDFEALAAERDQLKAEVESLRKDAERYRWLKKQAKEYGQDGGMSSYYSLPNVACSSCGCPGLNQPAYSYRSLSAAIDAAMAKEQG